jgi:hypothetical protein
MAVAVAADGQRVDRIDLVADRHQGADEQATVGLGPDHHLGRILPMGGQQLMHQPQPGQPLGHALSSGHAAEAVHHHHVVVSSAQSSPTNNNPPSSL